MSSAERCARVGELELCYQAFGPGTLPPLLLVMGLASQMVLWDDEFCQALANRGLRAIRFDNRDTGRYRAIGSGTYPPDPARLRAVAERCFERGIHPDVAARQLAAIIAAPDCTPLRGLRMPATVIHGAQDRLVMPAGERATAAAVPGARLVIVPGMGHHMPPALWPRLIDDIAATISRATEPGQPGLPVDEVSGGVMAAITAGQPVRAPRGREDGCTRAAAARRAEFARERTGVSLEPVSSYSFGPEGAAGNIEHFIGVAQEPIGLAGPLLVNGEHARGGFCVAMATAEGTLMAGHNRRGGLPDEAGGVTTVMHDHMQRAPSFLFPSARAARSGRRAKTGQYPPSWMLSTRFHYTTADAAGQKLTGKATQAACRRIVEPCQPSERRLARTTIDPGLGSAA